MNLNNKYREKIEEISLFPNVHRYAHIFGRLNPLSIMLETIGMQVFFIVDTSYCKTESDDLKDAIVFYYPPQIPDNQACSLCGQLYGTVQFSSSLFSPPKLIKLERGKFAVKKWGKYLFLLGGSTDSPDLKLLEGMNSLCLIFCFYYKNLDKALEELKALNCDASMEIKNIWTFFLKSVRHDHSRLGSIPGVIYKVPNLPSTLTSNAGFLIKSCQKFPSVLGGCIIFKRQLVVTQIPPILTLYLCQYRGTKLVEENFAGQAIPDGLHFVKVYLQNSELKKLLELNPPAKFLRRNKNCLASFNNEFFESETVGSSRFGSDTEESILNKENNTLSIHVPKLSTSKPEDLDKDHLLKEEVLNDLTSLSLPEMTKAESNITKLGIKKNNSFQTRSIAQESLKKINQIEEERRNLKRRQRKKKNSSKNFLDENLESASTATSSDMKPIEDKKIPPVSSLSSPLNNKTESSDSSFFEPKSWTPEVGKKSLYLKVDNLDTRASSQTEFGSSIELGVASPSYLGKTCPLFLNEATQATDSTNVPSSSFYNPGDENAQTKNQNVRDSMGSEDSDSFLHQTECSYDENVTELNLISITNGNTTLFLFSDHLISKELNEALSEVSVSTLQMLDSEITKCIDSQERVKQNNSSSIYVDNIWNTVSGNKYSKAYHLLEDFSELNIKSLSAITADGTVAYAMSSLTHQVYIQNTVKGGSPGIPNPQDPIARISGLTKQEQDKMGFYLLN